MDDTLDPEVVEFAESAEAWRGQLERSRRQYLERIGVDEQDNDRTDDQEH